MIVSAIDAIVHNCIDSCSQVFLFTRLKTKWEEIPVLKKINLSIKAGEKLAIVGENGAGKTTFVKLLCGLLRPQEGKISVNGFSLTDFEPEDYRNLFSAVFQRSGVLPVSIRDNIALNIWDDDATGEQKLFSDKGNQVFKNLASETMLSISHRLSSCRLCDRIAVLHDGRLVQQGSHEELLGQTDGKYAELWKMQAQYYSRGQ